MTNPFTVRNMKQALINLKKSGKTKKAGTSAIGDCLEDCEVYGTHNYVKFMPQNIDQLVLLEKSGLDLWDVPLDADITNEVDYYQDPSLPVDQITYIYTLVPEGTSYPPGVPYQILDQIFLFNEDSGDEMDDPWDPGDECVPYYEPSCQCWDECPVSVGNQSQTNKISEATFKLKKEGLARLLCIMRPCASAEMKMK